MYFSRFRKNSPGGDLYGRGFAFNHNHHTLIFGIKFEKTNWNLIKIKTPNQKTYIIFARIFIINITYRNIKKDFKQYARRIWRSRTLFVSSRGKK